MAFVLKKYPFSSILGWSASRYDSLNYCKRRYFYNYYSKYDREHGKDLISKLRAMPNLALETGSIAHDIIARIIKKIAASKKPVSTDHIEQAVRKMAQESLSSKAMMEVYYGERPNIATEELTEPVLSAITHLLDSERYQWILQMSNEPDASWIIEPEGYGETRIGGLKAYCKVDFLVYDGDTVHVLDWKTGKKDPNKYIRQMTGYSLFASEALSMPAEKIITSLAFLKDGYHEETLQLGDGDLKSFTNQVKNETEEMYQLTIDLEHNIPKGISEFPMTESTSRCAYCEFRQLCKRG
jgi:hypothetical protein